ncbi:hypothetical protein ES288_A02G072900v1 [Gossypium darwinii]|uniref:Uncharacterized protein n=1 Tax=Gossypium darwinii TaxID=34276 RepID=A0A5D2HB86_GOSDA|nr:hypothetical protein ES288_A02G072900v1 [Gossypium darwinii]
MQNLGVSNINDDLTMMGVNSHFNPTSNDPVEAVVKLNSEVLDPRRYSAVIFKENKVPKIISSNEDADLIGRYKGILISKGKDQGLRVDLSVVAALSTKSF